MLWPTVLVRCLIDVSCTNQRSSEKRQGAVCTNKHSIVGGHRAISALRNVREGREGRSEVLHRRFVFPNRNIIFMLLFYTYVARTLPGLFNIRSRNIAVSSYCSQLGKWFCLLLYLAWKLTRLASFSLAHRFQHGRSQSQGSERTLGGTSPITTSTDWLVAVQGYRPPYVRTLGLNGYHAIWRYYRHSLSYLGLFVVHGLLIFE